MNKITELPDPAIIEEEAGAWIIKLDSDNELSHEQHLAFKAWMGRSLAHREAVKSMAQFWGKMNVLTELGMLQRMQQRTQQKELQKDLQKEQPKSLQKQPTGERYGWFGFGGFPKTFPKILAATAFSLLMVVGIFSVQTNNHGQNANGLYATAIGQQKTISLADGSELQLNTNSQIRLDYSGDYRDIHLLQGEAHFIVAKDKSRPFRVLAGNGLVQAIGTAFTVYLNNNDVEVTITEGVVGLQSWQPNILSKAKNQLASQTTDNAVNQAVNNTAAKLHANTLHDLGKLKVGQRAVIEGLKSEAGVVESVHAIIKELSPQELERRLSWRKGYIVFKGAPLDQVVMEVERYSQVTIELVDPALAAIEIGGQFKIGEVGAILESLENNFGLKVKRISHNHVQLSYLSE